MTTTPESNSPTANLIREFQNDPPNKFSDAPQAEVVEKTINLRAPRFLGRPIAWFLKREGATVERKQTLEGVEETYTLKKEFKA